MIDKRVSRRAAVGLLLVTAAAGSWSAGAAGATTPVGTAGEGAFPLTIEHAYGTLELDAAPERVVTLGWIESDVTAALGIEPVGVSQFPFSESGLAPWLEPVLTTTPETLSTAGSGTARADLNLELIAKLDPDLIIATTYIDLANFYDDLSAIAPVLGPAEEDYTHIPWSEQALVIGQALGRPEAAARLVADTHAAVEAAIADNAGLDGLTYTLALGTPDMLRIVQDPDDGAVTLLGSFGLALNPTLAELPGLDDGSGGTGVSEENAAAIDADVVLIAFISAEAREHWESSPLFGAVPAVADGRYLAIDLAAISALRNQSPLSLPYAIESVVVDGIATVVG